MGTYGDGNPMRRKCPDLSVIFQSRAIQFLELGDLGGSSVTPGLG